MEEPPPTPPRAASALTEPMDASRSMSVSSTTTSAPTSCSSSTPTITGLHPALYVPQELRRPRDAFEVDDAINIIEDGEHVSVEDFGLGSAEISMGAPISMNVGMELHAMQQIDAFLGSRPAAELMAAPSLHVAPAPPPRGSQGSESTRKDTAALVEKPLVVAPATGDDHAQALQPPEAAAGTTVPLYSSRRDEKFLQLESHPIVQAVAPDGRDVLCKCGKSVRLNPPWYIIKFEQHLVSRNCTFLRKKMSKRDQEAQKKLEKAQQVAAPPQELTVTTAGEEHGNSESVASTEDDDERMPDATVSSVDRGDKKEEEQYRLMTADVLLKRFAIRDEGEGGDTTTEPAIKKAVDTLGALQQLPSFSRITPDGRFVECTCSELIILSHAWELREFHAHVSAKGKPPAPARRKPATSAVARRPRLGDGAAHRIEQRLIARETRWKPVSLHTELPCPGLRGERVGMYTASTAKLTGGGRARRRLAEELFPHKFVPVDKSGKTRARLNAEDKLMLRDAVESEAVWFVDHDANAVRSLDCRGSIAAHKGEDCCVSCLELKSNTNLRIAVTVATAQKRTTGNAAVAADTPGTQTRRGSNVAFALLEQEFDMSEEYARILRELFRADVEENSVKNMWFDMAELGITGSFTAHPAFLGLVESMLARKQKEHRGVGLQNMAYSDQLDAFMKSLSAISPAACDFFQRHLGGRKQKNLLLMKKRKLDASGCQADHDHDNDHGNDHELSRATQLDGSAPSFEHLPFDFSGSSHAHGDADMAEVDLASFRPEQSAGVSGEEVGTAAAANEETDAFLTDENLDIEEEDIDEGTVCPTSPAHPPPARAPSTNIIIPGYMPCRGLRDPKVHAYVTNAVQIIGGSRPKYVIAKELFPEAFRGARKIKITEKLSEEERGIVLDAIFSECLWRVDRLSNCVRSLRCMRRVDRKRGNGVCRACLELKGIANFRSVLCRAKVPKKVENLKYVPSVYTESDPFMRKLSKNASLRMLYQTVKRTNADEKKQVTFWLRLAKMGLFGHFRSHTVFEGLIASMVETKDRERRGVGKQNMLYAKPLDEFMSALAGLSMDAFELFSHYFCGRTARSQKVKKRKALTQLYDSALQQAMVANSLAMASAAPSGDSSTTTASTSASEAHSQSIMMPEELLSETRTITTAEMEENQRFVDRMLDEVRLSVNHDDHDDHDHDHDEHLDPQTYLDENGVLTTVL